MKGLDLDAHDPAAQPLRMSGIDGYVATLRASRDGRWLAMTTNADGRPGGLPHAAYLRQLADARPDSRPIRLRDHASVLEFSPDGRWLVITEMATVILLPLSQQGPVPGQQHNLRVADVGSPPQISTAGGWLGVANRRGDLSLWRLNPAGAPTGKQQTIDGTGSIIREFRFDPAGRRVVLRDVLGGVQIWPLDRRRAGAGPDFELQPVEARGAAISPDGRWFAWFGTAGGPNCKVRLIDLSSDAATPRDLPLNLPSAPGEAADPQQSAVGLAFSRDARRMVAVGDKWGEIWDLSRPEADPTPFSVQGNSIASVDISNDRFLTIVAMDNNVYIWDLEQPGQQRFPITLPHSENATATAVIAPDGNRAITVVSESHNVARTWRLTSQQLKSIAEEIVGRNLTPAESKQQLYWRQQSDPTFPSLPTPADESFTPRGPVAPMFGAPPSPKQTR